MMCQLFLLHCSPNRDKESRRQKYASYLDNGREEGLENIIVAVGDDVLFYIRLLHSGESLVELAKFLGGPSKQDLFLFFFESGNPAGQLTEWSVIFL